MSTSSAIWVDGERATALPLPDRGLEFGDGLFETLLVEQGIPLHPELHWQRLQKGFDVLDFPNCLSAVRTFLEQALDELKVHRWARVVIRITVTRGHSPRGYAPPECPKPRVVISASQLTDQAAERSAAAVLITAQTRWGAQPQLAGIKHCNRLEQVMAAAEKQRAGADEALMLGQGGQLVSVSAGNLFLRLGDELHTPVLDECGVEGTRRQLLIERWAPAINCVVRQSRLHWSDLEKAREVFYSNSVWGLRPVAAIGDLHWESRELCDALYRQYRGGQV